MVAIGASPVPSLVVALVVRNLFLKEGTQAKHLYKASFRRQFNPKSVILAQSGVKRASFEHHHGVK
jgi:hypothetical protein